MFVYCSMWVPAEVIIGPDTGVTVIFSCRGGAGNKMWVNYSWFVISMAPILKTQSTSYQPFLNTAQEFWYLCEYVSKCSQSWSWSGAIPPSIPQIQMCTILPSFLGFKKKKLLIWFGKFNLFQNWVYDHILLWESFYP